MSYLNPASVSSHPARGCSEQPVLPPKEEIIQRWGYLSVPRRVCRSPCLVCAHDRWVHEIWGVEELWLSSLHLSRLRETQAPTTGFLWVLFVRLKQHKICLFLLFLEGRNTVRCLSVTFFFKATDVSLWQKNNGAEK